MSGPPPRPSARTALFAYGSLVDRASAEYTLGRPLGEIRPARLGGWRRRFSQARDNRAAEKTFATPGGELPERILGLNLEPGAAPEEAPNGVLIEVTEADLIALDRRELRYDRIEVSAAVTAGGTGFAANVFSYVAKAEHLAVETPSGAVILDAYARTVEAAFEGLSAADGELYRETTLPYPAPIVEGVLVADRIPPGNPRDW